MRCAVAQRGFSIVTALFILVVLSSLAGVMATMGGTQHLTTLYSARGSRAYFAAHSAMEWAIHQARAGNCTATSFTLGGGTTDGFDVQTSCAGTSVTEGSAAAYNVYSLTATASRGTQGTPGYASRRIRSTITAVP